MLLDRGLEFLEAIAAARDRIRGNNFISVAVPHSRRPPARYQA
jgi:hypothetical protein